VLKVLLPLVVVGVTIAVAAMLYRTYKARKAATAAAKQQQQQTYVGSVPGGAF
jgi:flagellar basal body-associated protein FliL